MLGYFAAPPACPHADAVPGADRPRAGHPDLLADGRRTADIAAELYLSPKTVSNHLTNIFAKLEVADRAAAIIRARERGLGGRGRRSTGLVALTAAAVSFAGSGAARCWCAGPAVSGCSCWPPGCSWWPGRSRTRPARRTLRGPRSSRRALLAARWRWRRTRSLGRRHPADFAALGRARRRRGWRGSDGRARHVVGTTGLTSRWSWSRTPGGGSRRSRAGAAGPGVDGAHRRRHGAGARPRRFAAASAHPAADGAARGLVGPALYVGVVLPDIVDVRGLVVRAVVLASRSSSTSRSSPGVGLLEILGGEVPIVGVLAVVGVLAAMTFGPLQVMLRGVVDELLFGRRPDPLDAASRVAGQLGDDPAQALRVIREALLLPYAALPPAARARRVRGRGHPHPDLSPGGRGRGELVVGLRPGDLSLSRGDDHVLRLVAPLLAQALRARALAADLQESREADDHRGRGGASSAAPRPPRRAGPAAVRDRLHLRRRPQPARRPRRRRRAARQLRADTTTAIEDIRRLVYAMRPPALDELGLVPALRQQARVCGPPTDGRCGSTWSCPRSCRRSPRRSRWRRTGSSSRR